MFWDAFPYYIAMGMTAEQYWDGDAELARSYRKASRIKSEMDDQKAWLHGMYVYDALLRASPILRAFAKKGTKPDPYPDKPYSASKKEKDKDKAEKKAENPDKVKFEAWAIAFNAKFKEKEAERNG